MEVLIYGDGPIGLALANFARMRGAAWIGCIGHHDDRLERIRQRGGVDLIINSHRRDVAADLGDRTFDMVIDAVGSSAILVEGSGMLRPGGKVGSYGVLSSEEGEVSLLELKNNTVLHMLNWPYREGDVHEELIEMIRSGAVNPKDYYSHVMPIEEAPQAVQKVRSREAFKVVLSM
jgi:L-iditol 2-dehydrogenase